MSQKNSNGWLKKWRKTKDSWAFRHPDPAVYKIWSFLELEAAYEESTQLIHGHMVTIKPGQLNISNKKLSKITQIEETKVRRTLKSLKLVNQIAVQNLHRSVLITLVNWEKYQDLPSNLPSNCRPTAVQTDAIRKKKVRSKEYLHSTNTNDCAELSQEAGNSPPAVPDIALVFPCVGNQKEWFLTTQKAQEYKDTYPAVDIMTEAKRALQWTRDNPTNRKTFGGMPRFLNRWLSKEQDRKGNANGHFPEIIRSHFETRAERTARLVKEEHDQIDRQAAERRAAEKAH